MTLESSSRRIAVDAPDAGRARQALTKVPEITIAFWVLKLLTTGMGEAM